MIAFAIAIGLLPGFAWLFFYLREDPHPEPKRLIALAFVNGAAFAFLALIAQVLLQDVLHSFSLSLLGAVTIVAFAAIEEVMKFLAAYFTVHKSPAFDEPVDAMIYTIVAALGFATVENLGVVTSMSLESGVLLQGIFYIITFRFVGATLLHTLSSGFVGYFWAGGKTGVGLLIATVIHALFNILLLRFGESVYPLVFLLIIGFLVLGDFEKLKRKVV